MEVCCETPVLIPALDRVGGCSARSDVCPRHPVAGSRRSLVQPYTPTDLSSRPTPAAGIRDTGSRVAEQGTVWSAGLGDETGLSRVPVAAACSSQRPTSSSGASPLSLWEPGFRRASGPLAALESSDFHVADSPQRRRVSGVASTWHRRGSGVASTCQRRVSGVSAACQLVSATCQRDSVVWPHRRNTLFSLGALLYSASPLFSLAIASSGGPLSPPRRRALSSIIASQPVARIRPESPSSAACCRTRVPAPSNPGRFGSRLSPRAAFARCTLAAPRPSVQP